MRAVLSRKCSSCLSPGLGETCDGRLTWFKCAAMSEGSHIFELVLPVPFSFLGAMLRMGGALAAKLGSRPA